MNNKIKIKLLRVKDVNMSYFNWFKDQEVKKYVVKTRYQNINELRKYVQDILKKKNCVFLGIFFRDKHIGNLKFEKIDTKKKPQYWEF